MNYFANRIINFKNLFLKNYYLELESNKIVHWIKHSITTIYVEDTCKIIKVLQFQKFSDPNFSHLFNLLMCFSKLELKWPLMESFICFYRSKVLWFSGIKKSYALICKSLIKSNEGFIPYTKLQRLVRPSNVAHSATGYDVNCVWISNTGS